MQDTIQDTALDAIKLQALMQFVEKQ